MNRTEPNSQYQPRQGTLLSALQNVPGANILVGGRMRPVAEVLAERQAAADRAEAHKRAVEAARSAARSAEAQVAARDAEAVKQAYLARQADQAIVDAASKAVGAEYDHETIVLKIRHDKQIGQSGRIIRCYWRRGDATDMVLAPPHIQEQIAGCTCERAAAEIVAKRVRSNGFEVKAFYHADGLRELVLPKPGEGRGGIEAAEATARPDTVVHYGNTYRLGEPECPTKARFSIDYYPGGIPERNRTPRVFHVKQLTLVHASGPGRPPTGPDDAYITQWGRMLRNSEFEGDER